MLILTQDTLSPIVKLANQILSLGEKYGLRNAALVSGIDVSMECNHAASRIWSAREWNFPHGRALSCMFRVDFYAVSIVIIYHFPVRISFCLSSSFKLGNYVS